MKLLLGQNRQGEIAPRDGRCHRGGPDDVKQRFNTHSDGELVTNQAGLEEGFR